MNEKPLHTPYDGSSKPFIIGLKPLDENEWISIDGDFTRYLDEKDQLVAKVRDRVIVAEEGSEAGQNEVLNLLADYLPARFPEIYRRNAAAMEILAANRTVHLDDRTFPPIHIAARLVQEDLVLMRKGDNGWRLTAASLCFPSSWNLLEKFGKPMHEIHAPVPGFQAGTRNASLIERMFDNLQPANPVVRWNWSLYGDRELYHPASDNGMKKRFGDKVEPENIHLRLERQTLRKLPATGDILFTIRIFIDPLEALEKHEHGAELAAAIASQLAEMSDSQISYKGLAEERRRLLDRLNHLAGVAHR